MRIAVIDLGTNTFHLLVKDLKEEGADELVFRHKEFVKLAEGGIGFIVEASYQRGMETLRFFAEKMNELQVDEVHAIATAALRTASNGKDFIAEVKEKVGINIKLIPGDVEAELIARGVRTSIPFSEETYLIMDIGGGSVEFIFANADEVFWLQSFPIGAAVLRNRFHIEEPISFAEIDTLKVFLKETLQVVFAEAKKHDLKVLVGASGTFDTLVDLDLFPQGKRRTDEVTHNKITKCNFFDTMESILIKNLAQRKAMLGMPEKRSDMIVVACVLIDVIVSELRIDKILQTDYALKEGVFWSRKNGLEV